LNTTKIVSPCKFFTYINMSGLCQSLFLNLFFQFFDIESLAKFSNYYLEIIEIIIILSKCRIIQSILCVKFPVVKFWRFPIINLFHDFFLGGIFFSEPQIFLDKNPFFPQFYIHVLSM